MEYIRSNIKSLLIVVILLIGLVVGVYLVLHPQIFRSKADLQYANKLSGENTTKLNPEETSKLGIDPNIPTFKVNGRNFKVHYNP